MMTVLLVHYTYARTSCVDVLSLCQLIVNESPGAVKPYTEYTNDYLRYAHLPVKPHNDYYTISDIIANGQAMNGDIVNIMAVVKHVSAEILH